MKRPRIAVIGDTALVHGELTDGGAIATELALTGRVDVGFRSVAASRSAWEELESHFGPLGITTWLTIRNLDADRDGSPVHADLRMGDPIDIVEIFGYDLVVLASRDVRLRRFLSDLPVHTRPDVRILTLLHFENGVPAGERVEDILRFDALVGSDVDIEAWGGVTDHSLPTDGTDSVMRYLHSRLHGTNLRALVAWGRYGAATLTEPLEDIVTIPASHAPTTRSSAPWAAFVATLAEGMALHHPYREIVRRASEAYARRCQDLRRSQG